MWTWIDTLDWLGAENGRIAQEAWVRSHPGKNVVEYTNCPDIKAFWDSPIGRFTSDSYLFWRWVKDYKENLERFRYTVGWKLYCHFQEVRCVEDRPLVKRW